MKIDLGLALKILEEQVNEARVLEPDPRWVKIVTALVEACGGSNLTMIAMLGTALLAKATDPSANPFSLQVGDDEAGTSYSARNLCKQVLAAHANRLGIDLGVTGREPLNNSPFYKQPMVTAELNVHSTAEEARPCPKG